MQRLLCFDFCRHWRLEWIYERLKNRGPRCIQELFHDTPALRGIIHRQAHATTCPSECSEVNGMQINAILRITEKNHLLPFDLAERVVFDDDNLDRQLIFHGSNEVCHEHGKSAISHKAHALAAWIGDLR